MRPVQRELMSSYYSQKSKTAFFMCLRASRKASAFVVVSILLFLPVGPAFGEEITPPASEEQPALEEAIEEPESEPTDVAEETEPAEEASVEEAEPAATENVPDSVDAEAPPESAVPPAEPEENTDSELEEVLPALPTEADEGETAETGDANILPMDIPENTATTSEVSESESAPIASTTTTATTTTSSSTVSLENTDSEQGESGNSESPDVSVEDAENAASTTPEAEENQLPEESEPVVDEKEATSTEEAPKEEPLVETQINDSNRFQFGVDECVSMGNGSYYCAKADAEETVSAKEGVYVALDADGDKEIFYAVDGEQVQITHNTNEDDAPFYDEVSDTIIWHRLVDGRYQIFTYDVEDEEERQLTTERYNNMQASRHGEVIVWQGWVGNDWEIMLEDDGEYSMLTDNAVHDIDPYINGDYIIWQSFEEESWKVKVYNRVTKELDTIADTEGGSVKNPRLVLVYDTNYENGDVETRGYDLKSGEVVPLSATPAPLPEELPDPDPVEEDRALVQVVTQVKPKTENETDLDPVVPVADDVEDGNDATASSTLDIVIPPLTQAQSTTTSSANDLLIQPLEENLEATSTPIHEHIPDVVVMPYEMTATTTPDSQE